MPSPDILPLPPPGPLRWGWFRAALNHIAKARKLITDDDELIINETTGGLTLGRTGRVAAQTEYAAGEVYLTSGNRWTCGALNVTIDGVDNAVDITPVTIFGTPRLICVKVSQELTASGSLVTPRPLGELTLGIDYELKAAGYAAPPKLFSLSYMQFEEMECCEPGSRTTGEIAIPLAEILPGPTARQLWPTGYHIGLQFKHHEWEISPL